MVTDSAELLFVADDRRTANEVLKLSFEYARAEAVLLAKKGAGKPPTASAQPAAVPVQGIPSIAAMSVLKSKAEGDVSQAQDQIKKLQVSLAKAAPRDRAALAKQLVSAQGELELARSRVDSIQTMINFEAGTERSGREETSEFLAQIDELEHSVPLAQAGEGQKGKAGTATPGPLTQTAAAQAEPSGILAHIENLLALHRKQQMLAETVTLTDSVYETADQLHLAPVQALREIDRQGREMAAHAGAGDLATIKQRKAAFEALIERHKLNVNAVLPLAKEMVTLRAYEANLKRWQDSVAHRSAGELRGLIIRLIALAVLLAVIFVGAIAWRRLAFRYVQDPARRSQILHLRRLAVAVVIVLVLIFDFANELGTLATVMGFAAAGIAIALQNVILSLAGYFYISGRFGIKLGDRVQIAGVIGDVIDIGLFKLTLVELKGDNDRSQPSGRVVVFPNSVVFQGTGNFFKQIPGTNFRWNELKLTLAPDCDYRLAEKRLIDVVNEVFARYRGAVESEYVDMERNLNLQLDPPKPQSRLYLGESGVELVIRYPARRRNAAQIADEVSRRLVDALNREPGLRLATPSTPNIQASSPPPEREQGRAPESEAADGQSAPPGEAARDEGAADSASGEVAGRPVAGEQRARS
jgi:small-conductance mechanosensitive channel